MTKDCGCDSAAEYAALTALDEDNDVTGPDPRGTKLRRWAGLVAPYAVPTGDKRRFRAGALSNRDLPLPVKWQREDVSGHQTSVTVATADGMGYFDEDHGDEGKFGPWRGPGVYAYGVMLDPDPAVMPRLAEDVAEANLLLDKKVLGPSVDLDAMEYEPFGDVAQYAADERPEIEVTKGRISAVTMVQIPAFAEARPFAISEVDADEYASGETSLVASGVYEHGGAFPVAADTAWDPLAWLGASCNYAGAALYSSGGRSLFPVASLVDGYLQLVPGAVADAISVMAFSADKVRLDEGTKAVIRERLEELAAACDLPNPPWAQAALVAAAATRDWRPAAGAFANPKFQELTPIRIEGNRVYGHLASWKGCHIGFKDRCVTAPRSRTDYAHFHVGEVETDAGPLPVGKITLGGGHADTRLGFQAAAEHYDDAGTAVAAVRAGEDRFGIWVSGVMLPGQEDRFATLPLYPLSGDWRRVGGSMEMVAALAVNTPGFPVPRVSEAAGRPYALVAAGVIGKAAEPDADDMPKGKGKKKRRRPWDDDEDDAYSVAEIVAEYRAQERRDAAATAAVATLGAEFARLDEARTREIALQAARAF